MIKLKSLFRRGQGGPSGSSKHSNNNRNKSQSTTSLNSVVTDLNNEVPSGSQFYPTSLNTENTSERGVDVGDDQWQSHNLTTSQPSTLQPNISNTLPHKKRDKKGQKLPKQTAPLVPLQSQSGLLLTTNRSATSKCTSSNPLDIQGNVMTTLAAVVSGNTNSAVTQANNNSGIVTSVINAVDSNDLYKLNSALAAAASLQLINNEQQQYIEANKMQDLETKLESLEREKLLLESRVHELIPYQNESGKLKSDLLKIQSQNEKNQMEIANLKYENESLRNRLRDVVNSPLSDAEKHQIIQDSQRLHSSAPASIALPSSIHEQDGIGGTPCLTPDWDKHSSSSEISVACLQDKIIQMEETHYSTNEELQATLQELADLQTQLTDAHADNERLTEEKDVLFQSLCRQTDKLNEALNQVSSLQLICEATKEATEVIGATSEREQNLLDMIKCGQEEREQLLHDQGKQNAELTELRQTLETTSRQQIDLLDSTAADRKQMEHELLLARDNISQQAIEISRLSALVENAESKIEELEQDVAREKTGDVMELKVTELQDQCSRQQAEIRGLRDQLSSLNEECKIAKNNAKCAVANMEYRLNQLQQNKDKIAADYQMLLENSSELQVQCKCLLEEKTKLQNLLTESQKHLNATERKLHATGEKLDKEIKLRKQEAEEWQQFQSDLLMTVRVANDFKTEALSAREQLVLDNKNQKERIRSLEQQIEKYNKQQIVHSETQQSVLSSVQQEMASRRSKLSLNRQDSRLSVKTLIETIENNKQQVKSDDAESHYGSSSSLNSGTPEITLNILSNPVVLDNANNFSNEKAESVRFAVVGTTTIPTTTVANKGPLREQQPQQQTLTSNIHFNSLTNVSKHMLSGERKDPLNMLAKNGGSKRNALLKWCQNKTVGYRNIDITNFSSSWNDGLAFCAILHSYLPDRIPYDTLTPANKRRNFSLAFAAAEESVGIPTTLNINEMCQLERPDWTQVMSYVTAIYKHFET